MKTETTGRKRKIFTFIIALFGALLLWMYAIGYDTEIAEETFDGIPVEIIGVNTNGYTVADAENFSLTIDVRATGTRSDLAKIESSDFSAYVDISSVTGPGYTTFPVTVVSPNGLNTEILTVSNVTLYVDTFTSKTINIAIEKTYSSEYVIGNITQDIYAVSIYGPESVIGNAEAYTSFTLGNITAEEIRVSGEIKLRDARTKASINNQYITMSANTVEVTFTMHGTKTVPIQLVLQGGTFAPEDVHTSLSDHSLVLRGSLAELAQISMLTITCVDAEITDKLIETISASELLLANGIAGSVTAVDPQKELSYTVELPRIRYRAVTVPKSRIIVYGLPLDGSLSASPVGELQVTVLGYAEAVEAFSPDLMTVLVNYKALTQLPTGEYSGRAEISTGDSRVCVDDTEYFVLIEITVNTLPTDVPEEMLQVVG
ncbi:MAG: hypothetical protein IJD82_03360 [Clostridia bacterium]|nr:hypothetical protein [Clostridia bacterium]